MGFGPKSQRSTDMLVAARLYVYKTHPLLSSILTKSFKVSFSKTMNHEDMTTGPKSKGLWIHGCANETRLTYDNIPWVSAMVVNFEGLPL
jgi:hypothetical protein